MVVCPPFVALAAVKDALVGSKIGLGAQNMYWEEKGAFTAIFPLMLKDLATYVIIGHSERRQYFGETDATVNKRVKAALAHGRCRSCAWVKRWPSVKPVKHRKLSQGK